MGYVTLVVLADISKLHALPGGRSRDLGIIRQKVVQARTDVHATLDGFEHNGFPRRGQLAARRSDSDQERVGSRSVRERRDDRQSAADAEQFLRSLTGLRAIQECYYFVGLVADHARSRLR